jgi:subtilisin family serine protease
MQIHSPGTCRAAITVGSYDWNDTFHQFGGVRTIQPVGDVVMRVGSLSSYSNPGPLRAGKMVKPDVAAPGQFFTAPAALNTPVRDTTDPLGLFRLERDSTGRYHLFSGTSASTPYVAGVAALLLERRPGLTTEELRDLLRAHATHNATTGPVPNPRWGYGKLDLAAVRRMVRALR